MQQQFVHLNLHSEFSLIDGLIQIKPLMAALSKRGMSAVAITDHCNLFATVKIFQAAIAMGIKPIIGCEIIYFYQTKPEQLYSLVLLCQNNTGYRNLTRLISKAYQEGQIDGQPRILFDWIALYADGLIALSGAIRGDIGQALLIQETELAKQRAQQWSQLFPEKFYLEIQRTDRLNEDRYNAAVIQLADELQIPLVATNDVRFLNTDDFEAHEARVCIHDGYTLADTRRQSRYSRQQYLRSADEMVKLFNDLPQALQNTVEISKRCTVKLNLGQHYLPNFPTPPQMDVESYLTHMAQTGLEARFLRMRIEQHQRLPYEQRLQVELEVINSMGFAGYFLIVADFIQWARQNGVPVGPGRGSGAGSLVAYALMITDLDPLHYELLFERFLNPERVSMPDFDIDFCMEGRDRVIEYVAEKYGRHCVSQIITFGTMAAKAVVRDVGRVLGHPYNFVDKLAKLIPFEVGITLKDALEREVELRRRYDNEEEVKELFDLALKLEGITRNAGKHAGGVVIAPSHLTDFTAIYCEQNSTQIVSQFDKDDVEAAGLVKFDFLGLRTLTIINWTLQIIRQVYQRDIDIHSLPMDDKATFQLLKQCQTTAVFQLESRGMKELIHRLQPDCFEEIIALVALFRPGPLQSGMVDDFIDRKHGRSQVAYPHSDLENILKPTYGVILYQEQVMQIAQVLANYTLGGADLLRRAMGKKKPEEMAKQRAIFISGATGRGVEADIATTIFDLMEKFAGYGFNKSHSAAYALVAYQTAWLKAHYPAAFMAAVMSSDMDNTDKVVSFIYECRQMQLAVLPPSINQSQYVFTVTQANEIVYGLGAIKGVGEAAIQCLIDERNLHGHFSSLFDVCQRLDLRKLNRRVLEALIKSGSMDEWGIDRAILHASLEKAMQLGQQFHQQQQSQQTDIFTLFDENKTPPTYLTNTAWNTQIRLSYEKETLGLYLTGHPATPYVNEWHNFVNKMTTLNPLTMKKALIVGLITNIRHILTKRGKKLAIVTLEDGYASLDIVVFAELFEIYSTLLLNGNVIVVEGEIGRDDYTGSARMTANHFLRIDEARVKFAKCLSLSITPAEKEILPSIQALLRAYQGNCIVQFRYSNNKAVAALNLATAWAVRPEDDLLNKLGDLLGESRVEICY